MKTTQPIWKTHFDRIIASDISAGHALAMISLFEEYTFNRQSGEGDERLEKDNALLILIRLIRSPELPEWMAAFADLIFESRLTYEEAVEAIQSLRNHYFNVALSRDNGALFPALEMKGA
jgi:hypothetical protein